jgi:hypothetical protein
MQSEKFQRKRRKGRRPPLPASTHRTGLPGKGRRGQAVRRRRAHRKANARPAKGPETASPSSALLGLLQSGRRLQRGERKEEEGRRRGAARQPSTAARRRRAVPPAAGGSASSPSCAGSGALVEGKEEEKKGRENGGDRAAAAGGRPESREHRSSPSTVANAATRSETERVGR